MKTIIRTPHVPLPYPTRLLKVEGGYLEEYIIPPEKKGEVLKKLYPFAPVPSLNAEMLDIHEEKTFKVSDYLVLRGDDMDWLVSPYYPNSGGTVIDWVEPDDN
jgi:hypothetical protein